ncbi:CPBP family intramembrane metalloprotease [Clostridioides difficile]|uniref:CPBP family intramembrane glutamic endopeptidase n=1 Tax=Clostridioides difficile TaxID=1496 RepID=UPI000BB1A89D|nr:CPBP family intramembrane glutamic endopeptidase [Clostridioides difficile]MCF8952141.1 CPBP family intramembrane metalloprotease [Clostridioides difficile]MCW0623347.1 CPBP family intramembrane metalloprotease [Clostridioides difficile]MDM0309330.1 CPBP family intramembrane metalloprotease [Clostridioides difficile]MDM0378873.1 CPBP family intramembrane metalloprotease [Clostridioides difficile]MXQ47583.1 CPBP family intramembrane metalloprotease [Clostridioides difficile]
MIFTIIFYKKGRLCLLNLQSKWVNFLKPTYVSDEIKRKKLQVIIFFSITYGLSYSLGLLAICFNHLIDSEILAQFMMILPLSSVSIAKFYTEGRNNDKYNFYSSVILFFIIYFFIFIIESLKLISINQFQLMYLMLILISSLCVIVYSYKITSLYIFKNFKIGILLFFYFLFSQSIFGLIISDNQFDYKNFLNYILLPIISLVYIYPFLCEEYGWRSFLQSFLFDRFGKKIGIVMIGTCWSLWHLPLQFTLYSPQTPIIGAIAHLIYGIGLSIFLGYVYMKTKNIWFCSIMHVLINSLGLIFNDSEIIINYHSIIQRLIFILLFYTPFLFTKEYK